MELNFLLPEDWTNFERQFPDAHRHLMQCNLLREREHLYAEIAKEHPSSPYTAWTRPRLRELDLWYANAMKPPCEPHKKGGGMNKRQELLMDYLTQLVDDWGDEAFKVRGDYVQLVVCGYVVEDLYEMIGQYRNRNYSPVSTLSTRFCLWL